MSSSVVRMGAEYRREWELKMNVSHPLQWLSLSRGRLEETGLFNEETVAESLLSREYSSDPLGFLAN